MRYKKTELITMLEQAYAERQGIRRVNWTADQDAWDKTVKAWLDDKAPLLADKLREIADHASHGNVVTYKDIKADWGPYSAMGGLLWDGGLRPDHLDVKEPDTERLIRLLKEVIADEEVTSSALERAGFGNLRQYLAVPV
jgi:hypothetical protein